MLKAIDLFLAWKQAENLSPRTIDWYRNNLLPFAVDISQQLDPLPIDQIPASAIVHHLSRLRAGGKSPSTVEGRYRALYAFFNWLEDCDELGNPTSPIGHGRRRAVKRPRTPDAEPEHVPYEDFRKLVDSIDLANWLDYRDYCLISFLFWTGLRRQELLNLRIPDLDLNHGILRVVAGKGGKSRHQPIDGDLIAATTAYIATRPAYETDHLWLSSDHSHTGIRGALTATGLRIMLQRRSKRAGIRYWHPHAWRHGFAMNLLNAGVELSAVSAMMGHSSVQITESTYARWLITGLQTQYKLATSRLKQQ